MPTLHSIFFLYYVHLYMINLTHPNYPVELRDKHRVDTNVKSQRTNTKILLFNYSFPQNLMFITN